MNNNDVVKNSISLIVTRYRGDKSLREFAGQLSEKTPQPISHVTIKNWEDKVFVPEYYPMLAIAMHNDDWRRTFALEILAVLKPEQYQAEKNS